MKIHLKIDYSGSPYLELHSDQQGEEEIEDSLLELFIKRARINGVKIINESSFDTDNSYASIRLNKPVK